jgi:hypothetical protein
MRKVFGIPFDVLTNGSLGLSPNMITVPESVSAFVAFSAFVRGGEGSSAALE